MQLDARLSEKHKEELKGMFSVSRRGFVQITQRRRIIIWTERTDLGGSGTGTTHRQMFICTPCGMQRTSASNIRASLNGQIPDMSFEEVIRFAKHLRCLFMHLGFDSASGSIRLGDELALATNTVDNILLILKPASCHQAAICESD